MAWVESHEELDRHPKVQRLADAIGEHYNFALGALHRVWYWGLKNADEHGAISGDRLADDIEFIADWRGERGAMFAALIDAGFIDAGEAGYVMHDWPEYGGQFAAKVRQRREDNAKRQRDYRERHKAEAAKAPSGPSKAAPSPKRPAVRHEYSDDFEAFWDAYPLKVSKHTAYEVWLTRIEEGIRAADMQAAARHYAAWCQQTSQSYIKHPSTFIGPSCHYEDFVAGIPAGGAAAKGRDKGLTVEEIATMFDDEPAPAGEYIEGEVVEV